jgi:GH18 family chitinase
MVDGDKLTCMPQADRSMMSLNVLRRAVAALQGKGIRVSISVAGGVIPACSGDWRTLLAPDRRESTVAGLLQLVDHLGLDGLDVDIEGVLLTQIDKAGDFTPFIAALSAGMKRRGKLLSCATASYEGGMIPVDSIPYFDLVNVMSYDAIGPSWGQAGAEHSTYAGAMRDLELWRARGVKKERLVLGVPFYGYGFGEYRANWAYRDLVSTHGDAARKADVIGKACAGCSYVTFNTPATLLSKAKLSVERGAGVMVWEVSQDSEDGALLAAIEAGFADAARRHRGNAPTFR